MKKKNKKVIAFTGYSRVGKDTAAFMLNCMIAGISFDSYMKYYHSNRKGVTLPYKSISFADVLYDAASILSKKPREVFESDEFKDKPIYKNIEITHRGLVSLLGESVRNDPRVGRNFFAKIMFKGNGGNLLVTDLRNSQEEEELVKQNAYVIRITKEGKNSTAFGNGQVDRISYDFDVTNNGSLEELWKQLEVIYNKIFNE